MEAVPSLRRGLSALYGERLKGVYVFGSRARADADAESDLDVLVVLDRIDSYAGELERTSALIATISLALGFPVSRVFAAQRDWETVRTPFLAGVRADAVPA